MKIVPAILTAEVEEYYELMRKIKAAGKFERVQVDFIDEEYAANRTISPAECDLVPYLPIRFDAQLMVTENNVLTWGKAAQKVGFERIIPQVESISRPEDYECLAMDFHSPVAVLKPYLAKLKYVLVMSVEPGFGGQRFVEAAMEDVRELEGLRREKGYKYLIGVDGGVEKEEWQELKEAGVDEVAVGAKRALEW